MSTNKMLINGEWRDGRDEFVDTIRSPSTAEEVASVRWANLSDLEAALAAAENSRTRWAKIPGRNRMEVMLRAVELLRSREDQVAPLISSECGKPIDQAHVEVRNAARILEYFAEEAARITGDILSPRNAFRRSFVIRQPIGVAGIITPWNNPIASLSYWLGPALAAGCTVVSKPSEIAPLSPLAVASCFTDAGTPEGVLNMIIGDPTVIGPALVNHPIARKIAFIGSESTGKAILKAGTDNLKRITLELGGQAPAIVCDDVEIESSVEQIVAMAFKNTGQNCLSVNRILVDSTIHGEFVEALKARVARLRVGLSLDTGVEIGPLINADQLEKVESHVSDAVSKGGRVVFGGKRSDDPALSHGNYYLPTVIDDIRPEMMVACEETFGPVAPVMKVNSTEEAVDIANGTPYGLIAYVLSKDLERAWRIAEELEFGIVGINDLFPLTPEAPVVGWKQSGIGVKGSSYGLDEFLKKKLIGWKFSESG